MIYIARTEWRMPAREVWTTPEWELNVLLAERARGLEQAQQHSEMDELKRAAHEKAQAM